MLQQINLIILQLLLLLNYVHLGSTSCHWYAVVDIQVDNKRYSEMKGMSRMLFMLMNTSWDNHLNCYDLLLYFLLRANDEYLPCVALVHSRPCVFWRSTDKDLVLRGVWIFRTWGQGGALKLAVIFHSWVCSTADPPLFEALTLQQMVLQQLPQLWTLNLLCSLAVSILDLFAHRLQIVIVVTT